MPWVEDEQSGSHYEKPRARRNKQLPLDGLQSIQDQAADFEIAAQAIRSGDKDALSKHAARFAREQAEAAVADRKPLRSDKQLANDERLREMAKRRAQDRLDDLAMRFAAEENQKR